MSYTPKWEQTGNRETDCQQFQVVAVPSLPFSAASNEILNSTEALA
jgi:hypothetical protein